MVNFIQRKLNLTSHTHYLVRNLKYNHSVDINPLKSSLKLVCIYIYIGEAFMWKVLLAAASPWQCNQSLLLLWSSLHDEIYKSHSTKLFQEILTEWQWKTRSLHWISKDHMILLNLYIYTLDCFPCIPFRPLRGTKKPWSICIVICTRTIIYIMVHAAVLMD